MKIAIVGPGAMGCLFACLFTEAGLEVCLLDKRPERAALLEKEGILVKGLGGERKVMVRATASPEEVGPADLVIVTVKAYDTVTALSSIPPLLHEGSVVITLQNGIGNVEAVTGRFGKEKVIGGTTSQGATLLAEGQIFHAGEGMTTLGSLGDGAPREALHRALEAFQKARLPVSSTQNLEGLLWSKLMINVGINPLTALTRLRNGALLNHSGTRWTMRFAVNEASAVASKKGIKLLYEDVVAQVEKVCNATGKNISSMLQDVLRKRPTEIDYLNGAVVREAKGLGLETPVNAALHGLVKTIESSYEHQV